MKNEKKVQQFLSSSARIGRRIRRRRNQQSLHLPEEIIEEIRSRLPVKSLFRFRCVSKSWRSLLGSKTIIKTLRENSIKNPCFPHQRVIIQKGHFDSPVQYSLLSALSELTNTSPLSPFSDPTNTSPLSPFVDPTNTTVTGYDIVGSCNGLLCIRDKQKRFHLWNPSTGISKILPEISNLRYVKALGFGWVESSDEYKLFFSVGIWVCKVYSSRTKSWKTIKHCPTLHTYRCKDAVFVGGKLYWTNNIFDEDIFFLDSKSEVFGRIKLPFDIEKSGFVSVLGGVLCYIVQSREVVRVWVMKEEVWKRVATFANLVELLQPAPLAVGPKGEILVTCGSLLLVYNPQDNVFRRRHVVDVRSNYTTHVYVESLVSPEDL